MAGTVPGTGDTAEKQTDQQTTLPALVELSFSWAEGRPTMTGNYI